MGQSINYPSVLLSLIVLLVSLIGPVVGSFYYRQSSGDLSAVTSPLCSRAYPDLGSRGTCILTCSMSNCTAAYLQTGRCYHIVPCNGGQGNVTVAGLTEFYARQPCRESFTKIGSKCYVFFHTMKRNKDDAKRVCQTIKAELATPDETELNSLLLYMKNKYPAQTFYTAFRVNSESELLSDQSKTTTTKWQPNEPNCVVYRKTKDGKAYKLSWGCYGNQKAVCQNPKGSSSPSIVLFKELFSVPAQKINSIQQARALCESEGLGRLAEPSKEQLVELLDFIQTVDPQNDRGYYTNYSKTFKKNGEYVLPKSDGSLVTGVKNLWLGNEPSKSDGENTIYIRKNPGSTAGIRDTLSQFETTDSIINGAMCQSKLYVTINASSNPERTNQTCQQKFNGKLARFEDLKANMLTTSSDVRMVYWTGLSLHANRSMTSYMDGTVVTMVTEKDWLPRALEREDCVVVGVEGLAGGRCTPARGWVCQTEPEF